MSKEFKIVLIVFAIVAIICGIVYFTIGNNTDKKANTNSEIESKIPKGLVIKNEKLEIEDDTLNLTFTVYNKNKKSINIESINVIVFDNKDNEVSNFVVNVNQKLDAKDKIQLFASDDISFKGKTSKIQYIFKTKKR